MFWSKVKNNRARRALALRRQGKSFAEITNIMDLKRKEDARALVARGETMERMPQLLKGAKPRPQVKKEPTPTKPKPIMGRRPIKIITADQIPDPAPEAQKPRLRKWQKMIQESLKRIRTP